MSKLDTAYRIINQYHNLLETAGVKNIVMERDANNPALNYYNGYVRLAFGGDWRLYVQVGGHFSGAIERYDFNNFMDAQTEFWKIVSSSQFKSDLF